MNISQQRVKSGSPRQSLSDPAGFPAPGDAQSRWHQPERRPGDRFWQPERPSQFSPKRLPRYSEARFRAEAVQAASKIDLSWGPLGLIAAALSIPWSRKTPRVTQTLTREPLFTRCHDIFTEQPPGVCGRSIEVIYRANHRLFGTFGLIAAAPGIPRSR